MAKLLSCGLAFVLSGYLFGFTVTAHAQNASGLVEGHVTTNDGNVPARGASIQLVPLARFMPDSLSTSNEPPSILTDFNGVYLLPSVEPGSYIVNATMPGYEDTLQQLTSKLKRATPEQQKDLLAAVPQVLVKPGISVHQDLILRRAGAISGRVLIDTGGVLSQVPVTAAAISDEVAAHSTDTAAGVTQRAMTDDRGAYRIAGLPPGNYRVSVEIRENFFGTKISGPQKVTVFPKRTGVADLTVFAPNAVMASDAKPIALADGDEIGTADIVIPTRLLHSLSGIVTRGGQPLYGASLSLERDGNRVVRNSDALTMSDGSFQFDLLPDGTYNVVAKTYNLGKATATSSTPVSLQGSDITGLAIDLTTASKP